MKIAIPTAEGVLCSHFGHSSEFTVIDVDPEKKEIIQSSKLIPPPHEPGIIPQWLSQIGCDVIIAGGMGGRAMNMFKQKGINVIVGAPSNMPEELVMTFLNGQLFTGENICDNQHSHGAAAGKCQSHQQDNS